VVLWRSDFEAYRTLGRPITGTAYVKAPVAGAMPRPAGLLAAVLDGWRWGQVGHELERGCLSRANAEWVAQAWLDGVPV
jgi:hypothetical protein